MARHEPEQPAAGLLNIATAEISSGLDEEPLQISPNFSSFLLVYRIKSLKMALKVFKCTHRKSPPPPSDTMTQGGGKQRGEPAPSRPWDLRQPLKENCLCVKCSQGRKWERRRSGARLRWHHGYGTRWQSCPPFVPLSNWRNH